jgi:acetylornithine deacetylase/succinyl-diaminopimelate desuccinylase-like protein
MIRPQARPLVAALFAASVLASGAVRAAAPDDGFPPPADRALGRAILKEMIETDTTHEKGSTGLALAIAARLKAAGFSDSDVQVLAPPDHPTKGNVVVRLHGKGKARPVLYIGHLDVVNAKPEDWTYNPFTLTEKDGYFYGRGTIDMKSEDAGLLETVIRLKREGFKGEGDIIVALTADEEAGGDANGVEWLFKAHRDLVDAALVINPDSFEAGLKNGKRLYLGLSTSEKVYATYAIEATDRGGHSSRPHGNNPIYRLSAALTRIDAYRFPLSISPTVKAYFARRATLEEGQIAADMASAGSDKPDPEALERLSKTVDTAIMLRTTCVATEITGGHAESALPQMARATIQCRVLPGDDLGGIKGQLAAAANDPSLVIKEVYPGDKSPESPLDPKLVETIEKVTHSFWPKVVILPVMEAGASDNAFSRTAGVPSYGIDAAWEELEDGRAHGKDERIGVEVFDQNVEFTYRLMKALAVQKR